MTDAPVLDFGSPHPNTKTEDAGQFVDVNKLLVSRLLIQANSGGGKSTMLRWLLESTKQDGLQHIIIDREGEFSTLREKYQYVLVGPDGDLAADMDTVSLLPRRIMETNASVIIDLSGMAMHAQREYVAAFIEAINELPRELWQDCLIVIDEAHVFAPEAGKGSSSATEAIAVLASIGRKRGYCVVLATQRLAKLNKDVAAECLNKLIGRTSDEDIKRAAEELAFDKKGARELRALPVGHFWGYGPAIAPSPTLVRSGQTVTKAPPRGRERAGRVPAPESMQSLLAAFADLPQQAERERSEEDKLRRDIHAMEQRMRGLERELAEQSPDKAALLAEYQRGFTDGSQQWLQRITDAYSGGFSTAMNAAASNHAADLYVTAEQLADMANSLRNTRQRLVEKATDAGKAMGSLEHYQRPLDGQPGGIVVGMNLRDGLTPALRETAAAVEEIERDGKGPVVRRMGAKPARAVWHAAANGTQEFRISKPQQRILDTLCAFVKLGVSAAPAGAVAPLAGAGAASSRGFEANIQHLRRHGLVISEAGKLALTNDGFKLAVVPATPMTLGQLHGSWYNFVSGPQADMLRALVQPQNRHGLTRIGLAGITSQRAEARGFQANLSALNALGLIEKEGDLVKPSAILFPPGLK